MNRNLWIHPAFSSLLAGRGFRSFEDFLSGGRVIRKRGGKENVEVEFGEEGSLKKGYLKRHRPSSPAPAATEWENWQKVKGLGIRVPEVIAFGWGPEGSFIMTEEIQGGWPLDQYLRDHFPPPVRGTAVHEKRQILEELAAMAQALHEADLCHRDYYLCHVFITPREEGRLHLIDLQRVRRARPLKHRWIVKDLAALNYSATKDFTSTSDRIRFFKAYTGIPRLDVRSKRMIRRVVRKTERIRRHDMKSGGASP
ncbi:MAG: lipopolysaccharide kinase InaA family protein [Planctomycetota bacterium]|jgi:heptose I phosphotransferase